MTFKELQINSVLINGLTKMGCYKPTPLQINTITQMGHGRDFVIQGESGSGKTLAYLLSIFNRLKIASNSVDTLIITPNDESAMKVYRTAVELISKSGVNIRIAALINGMEIAACVEKLSKRPHIIIGTPERILLFINKGGIITKTINYYIVEKCSRTFDNNSNNDTLNIIKHKVNTSHLVFVDDSLTNQVVKIINGVMKEPVIINNKDKSKLSSSIVHVTFESSGKDKLELLIDLVAQVRPNKCVIFINNTYNIDSIEKVLVKLRFKVLQVLSVANTGAREKATTAYNSGKADVIITTTEAARGLGITGTDMVINYDVPEKTTDYMFRAHFAGKVKTKSYCISFVTSNNKFTIGEVRHEHGIKFSYKKMVNHKIVSA